MIAPFNRDGTQQSKQGLGKPGAEEILAGGEVHEGKGWVKNIFGEKGGDRDKKRIVHGGMIRNEEYAFAAPGNIVPSPHAGKIEGEAKKQKRGEASGNHGYVGCPDAQTREYFCNQHDVYCFPGRE